MRDDDVVLQRPDDVRIAISVFATRTVCTGASASYVLKRIAYRAGAYAPGIHESILHELHEPRHGSTPDETERWLHGRLAALRELGYRFEARRVTSPTEALVDWVEHGGGFRGVVLAARELRAVGLTFEGREAGGDGALVLVDPSSRDGVARTRVERGAVTRRDRIHDALMLHWLGWG